MDTENRTHARLLENLRPEKVHMITGKNGAGKSRFFRYATQTLYTRQNNGDDTFKRLICLSGTIHDKYPHKIIYNSNALKNDRSIYLGYQVNNNMYSELAPFRKLLPFILESYKNKNDEKFSETEKFLESINIDANLHIKIEFKKLKNAPIHINKPYEFRLDFKQKHSDQNKLLEALSEYDGKSARLSDIDITRKGEKLNIKSLSSGERTYIQSILGTAFCGAPNSAFFYDEPENSLHPEWHLKMIRDLSELIFKIHPKSSLIIATHSPLVAASIPNHQLLACELPKDQMWKEVNLYGKTNDAILSEHFHLFSPRSKEVAITIQACLDEISKGQISGSEFQKRARELKNMNLNIRKSDPLFDVIQTIISKMEL